MKSRRGAMWHKSRGNACINNQELILVALIVEAVRGRVSRTSTEHHRALEHLQLELSWRLVVRVTRRQLEPQKPARSLAMVFLWFHDWVWTNQEQRPRSCQSQIGLRLGLLQGVNGHYWLMSDHPAAPRERAPFKRQ